MSAHSHVGGEETGSLLSIRVRMGMAVEEQTLACL